MKFSEKHHEKLKQHLRAKISESLNVYKNSKQFLLDCLVPSKTDTVGRKLACKIINETSHILYPSSKKERDSFKRYVDKYFHFKGPYRWDQFK